MYKEFPLTSIHQNALNAARAALAAKKQGKFWPMHDKLFANQRQLDMDSLKKYAQELGLNVPQFLTDMSSPGVQKQIDQETQLGHQVNVRGTPTFFINGKLVNNRSFPHVKEMIDAALKQKAAS